MPEARRNVFASVSLLHSSTLSRSRFLLSASAFVFRLFRVGVDTVRACNVREENGKTTPACGRIWFRNEIRLRDLTYNKR